MSSESFKINLLSSFNIINSVSLIFSKLNDRAKYNNVKNELYIWLLPI